MQYFEERLRKGRGMWPQPARVDKAINDFTAMRGRIPPWIEPHGVQFELRGDTDFHSNIDRLNIPLLMRTPVRFREINNLLVHYPSLSFVTDMRSKLLEIAIHIQKYQKSLSIRYFRRLLYPDETLVPTRKTLRIVNITSLRGKPFDNAFRDFETVYTSTRGVGTTKRQPDEATTIGERLEHMHERATAHTGAMVYVAYEPNDNVPVCTASAYPIAQLGNAYYLGDLNTYPEYQNRGFAGQMLHHRLCEIQERERKPTLIFSSVFNGNEFSVRNLHNAHLVDWFTVRGYTQKDLNTA